MRNREAHNAWNRAWYAKLPPEKKAAISARRKEWRKANPERDASHKNYTKEERAAYMREWRKRNADKEAAYRNKPEAKERSREYQAAYWEAKKEQLKPLRKEQGKEWRQANPAKVAAHAAKRRAMLLRATHSWLTSDDLWMIDEVYDLCALRSRITGVKHHVDHIYPLQGRKVCGLHTPFNLQVLPAKVNQSKRNRLPDDLALAA